MTGHSLTQNRRDFFFFSPIHTNFRWIPSPSKTSLSWGNFHRVALLYFFPIVFFGGGELRKKGIASSLCEEPPREQKKRFLVTETHVLFILFIFLLKKVMHCDMMQERPCPHCCKKSNERIVHPAIKYRDKTYPFLLI